MGILLDIIILVLFIFFITSGYKIGLVRAFMNLVGTILALIISLYLSNIISELIYNNYVRNIMVANISSTLNEYVGQDINTKADAVLRELPSFLSGTLSMFGVDSGSVESTIENTTGNATYAIVDLFAPVIISVIKTISMSVLFFVLMIPIKFLTKFLVKIVRLPGLRQLDHILGALLGGLKCLFILAIIVSLLKVLLPIVDEKPELFSDKSIESTILFKSFYKENLFYKFITNEMVE